MGPETISKSIKNDWADWPIRLGKFSAWNHDWLLPKIQAHRGYHQDAIVENSFESLAVAKEKGYKMAEIDVQFTKDKIPVVFHDFTLSDRFRLNVKISEMSYEDLNRLANFPALKDVLATKERPEFLNIEIKSKNFIHFGLEESVVELINRSGAADLVLLSSFNPWSLLKIKFLDARLTRALLVTDEPEIWNLYYLRRMWLAPLIEPHVLNIRHSMVDPMLIAKLKSSHVLTSAWTVNDLERAKTLVAMGVDSIISDTILPHSLT
ncbi:MAG: glycerophosphodiester phosphodiesterase [Bdellovibrionaceae bacterium]|nr:glycerophosphodiester phosphodiesterase [Pseudobdellovibrionaceae bacterium]